MNIDYRSLLPVSQACSHPRLAWESETAETPPEDGRVIEVAEGTPGALTIDVRVNCPRCLATASKTFYYVVAI